MKPLERINYRNHVIEIHHDNDCVNPREDWDCSLGKMICFHRRYTLGDKHHYKDPEHAIVDLWETHASQHEMRVFILATCKGSISKFREVIGKYGYHYTVAEMFDACVRYIAAPDYFPESLLVLPLYLYDHGGITMSTSRFSCPWDSGQVGFIYMTVKDAVQHFNYDLDAATKALQSEVEVYNYYLTGQCYGYVVKDSSGKNIDSCWGFLGDGKDCIDEAKAVVDWIEKERLENTENYARGE